MYPPTQRKIDTAGFVQVMENLESHGIKQEVISFSRPGKSWNIIILLVLKSHGKLKFCLIDY